MIRTIFLIKFKDHCDIKNTNLFFHFLCSNMAPTHKRGVQVGIQTQDWNMWSFIYHHWAYRWFDSICFFEKFFHQLEMVAFITTLLPYNIGWVFSLHDICKFDCIKTCIQDGYLIFIIMEFSDSLRLPLLIFYIVTQWSFLYFHFQFVWIISSPNCT